MKGLFQTFSDIMDETIFLKACQDGDLKHISSQISICDKLDINAVEKVDGNTGLILAVRENREDLVSWLLDNTNIDVNIANKFGYTALMVAAQNGNADILVSLLRLRNIDLDLVNKAGRKAEDCGRKKHSDMVRDVISEARKRKRDVSSNYSDEPLTKVSVKRNVGVNYIPTAFVGEIKTESEEGEIQGGESDAQLSQKEPIPTELKTILTARLENCLIDLGSPSQNLRLCLEMFKMGSSLGLSDLASISKKAAMEYLNSDTVFQILQVLHKDVETREICLNFVVSNIDDIKKDKQWKVNLKNLPGIAIELVDRLR